MCNHTSWFPSVGPVQMMEPSPQDASVSPSPKATGVWSKGMSSSGNTSFVGRPAERLSSFQADYVPSNSDTSDVMAASHGGGELPERRGAGGSRLMCSTRPELHRARGGSTRRRPSPAPRSCGRHDWNLDDGHRAKRARVENIIKGISSCPATPCADATRVDQSGEATGGVKEGNYHTCSDSPREALGDSDEESGKYQGWKKVKLMNYIQRAEKIKLMADVLKYELSKAVSRSVDYIFKSMPLSPNHEGGAGASPQSSVGRDNKRRLSCYGGAVVRVPDVQTEALSLVVQKPQLEKPDKFIPQSASRARLHPEPPVSLAVREDQPEENQIAVRQRALTCLQDGRAKFTTHWDSVKVRSKVKSRSLRKVQADMASVGRPPYLPRVKNEPDSLVKNDMLNVSFEGLSTNHLKKAKLMFFYTRYPSSLILKMCFHDVQFTRCITSQLIKWFSNFREFYYIQMEKFARRALTEGVADVRRLAVGRESELFRALNTHYNKANNFQVPDRFLEVAEITLREFYIAISLGKDHDPSWKKAIYKVICKLDSDVPADFQSYNTG